jgi:hypothetical protein
MPTIYDKTILNGILSIALVILIATILFVLIFFSGGMAI